jgi:hypothetical protein
MSTPPYTFMEQYLINLVEGQFYFNFRKLSHGDEA